MVEQHTLHNGICRESRNLSHAVCIRAINFSIPLIDFFGAVHTRATNFNIALTEHPGAALHINIALDHVFLNERKY